MIHSGPHFSNIAKQRWKNSPTDLQGRGLHNLFETAPSPIEFLNINETRAKSNRKKSAVFAEFHLLFGKPGTPCLVPADRCRTPGPWRSSAPRAPCWCRRNTPCQAGGALAGTPAGSPWKHIPLSRTKDLGMNRTMGKARWGPRVKRFFR